VPRQLRSFGLLSVIQLGESESDKCVVGGSCKSSELLIIWDFLLPLCGWKCINYVNAQVPLLSSFHIWVLREVAQVFKPWDRPLPFGKGSLSSTWFSLGEKFNNWHFFFFSSHNFNILRTASSLDSELLRSRANIQLQL
jgi:hypothetical protein